MAARLAAAQARSDQAEAARAAAETDRDAAIEQVRQEAATRIAIAEPTWMPRSSWAGQKVSAAKKDRDQALARAEQAEKAARIAQQDAARAQAAEQAARAETGRVRVDAEKMLAGFPADAARGRADLRAQAERAEGQADAYRDELARLRAASHDNDIAAASSRTPRHTRQATQP